MLTPVPSNGATHNTAARLLPVSAFVEPIMRWSRLWEVPYLHTTLRIRYSERMRKNSGLCRAPSGDIVLNAQYLRYQPEDTMATVCHYVAHAAAYQLHGCGTRRHGPEWQYLVEMAGFSVPATCALRPLTARQTRTYEHYCPQCDYVCESRSGSRAWLCPRCIEDGYVVCLEVDKYGWTDE